MRFISVILFFSGFVTCAVGLFPIGVIMILGGIFFWIKADADAPSKNNTANQTNSQNKTQPVRQPAPKTKTTPKPPKQTKVRNGKKDFNHIEMYVPGAPAADAYAFHGEQSDYFYQLLSNAFPGYTVRTNVALDELHTVTAVSAGTASWTCQCGACNTTAFCGSCGSRRPAAPAPAPKFRASQAYTANISFLLCQNGTPKLAIMLGDRDYRYQYVCDNTEKALIAQGIPVQYYIDTFRNKASYVYSRVMDQLS